MHGQGCFRWPDGRTYHGNYRNGLRSGWAVTDGKWVGLGMCQNHPASWLLVNLFSSASTVVGQSLATGQTFKSNSFYSLVSLVLKVTIACEDHLPLWLVEILWKRKLKFASQSLFLRRLAEVFSSRRVLCLLRSACRQEILMHPQCNRLPSKAKTPSGDPYSSNLFLKVAVVSSLQFWACQVPQTPSLTGMATASSYGQMGALTKAGMYRSVWTSNALN